MCSIRKEEVFAMLAAGQKSVIFRSATERLKQVIEAQNLLAHGQDRVVTLTQAKEYYNACLEVSDWSEVVALTGVYLDRANKENNDYLRYVILSLLDVLEEAQTSNDVQETVTELLERSFSVRLDFTSSKGLTLKEVYERAGTKEQFLVILRFLRDHPRCTGGLREAVEYLMEHFENEKERKMCA